MDPALKKWCLFYDKNSRCIHVTPSTRLILRLTGTELNGGDKHRHPEEGAGTCSMEHVNK